MFVPKIDDGVPVRQTALAEIDRAVAGRLGPTRVTGNAQPAAFNRQVAMYLAKRVGECASRELASSTTDDAIRPCVMRFVGSKRFARHMPRWTTVEDLSRGNQIRSSTRFRRENSSVGPAGRSKLGAA